MTRDYIELEIPQGLPSDSLHALEPFSDITQVHLVTTSELWPPPSIISSAAGRIRILNLSGEPFSLNDTSTFVKLAPSSPIVLLSILNTLSTAVSNQSTCRLLHLVPASHQLYALTRQSFTARYAVAISLPPR